MREAATMTTALMGTVVVTQPQTKTNHKQEAQTTNNFNTRYVRETPQVGSTEVARL